MSKSIAVAYTMKKKAKNKPEKGVHTTSYEKGVSGAGEHLREAKEAGTKEEMHSKMEKAKMEHESVLEEMHEMPAPKLKASGGMVKSGDPTMNYAEGGTVEETPAQAGSGPVDVECPHCKKSFSHGGMVANDLGQGDAADKQENEFDVLVKSGGLDAGTQSSNLVGRAMAKRKAQR